MALMRFISESTQWVDQDTDGFGDNPAPAYQPDGVVQLTLVHQISIDLDA